MLAQSSNVDSEGSPLLESVTLKKKGKRDLLLKKAVSKAKSNV